MDIAQKLTDCFKKAIRKSLTPCPLIGEKWFKYNPDGKPADFQFAGVAKLAKAIGMPKEAMAKRLVKQLDLRELDGRWEIAPNAEIWVTVKKAPPEKPAAKPKAAKKAAKAPKKAVRKKAAAPKPEAQDD